MQIVLLLAEFDLDDFRRPAVAALETPTGAYLRLQRGSSARISPVSNGWVCAANHSARAAARARPRSSIGRFKTSSKALSSRRAVEMGRSGTKACTRAERG